MRKLVFFLLRATFLPRIVRETLQRGTTTIILYHDLRPDVLEQHLASLKPRYTIISLRAFLEARRRGRLQELPPKSLVITLDDGHRGNYDLLPVLRKHHVPVTVFLCTRIVGTSRHFWFQSEAARGRVQGLKHLPDPDRLGSLRQHGFEEEHEFETRQALTWDEVREMSDLVDFQSHTLYHPILPRCGEDRARREITESREDLEAHGFPAYALSFPNGDYSERDVALAREAGYQCAITLDPGFNGPEVDSFRLRRFCLTDSADVNELLVKTSGLWSYLRRRGRDGRGGDGFDG